MTIQDMESADEQLTAYLDGELSSAESAALERQLVDNEALRIRLAELRRAYDLLDELPETPHNQRFTQSTLELVVKDLTGAPEPQKQKVSPPAEKVNWLGWPRILVLVALMVSAGVVSGLAMRLWRVSSDMRDLGLIASMPGMEDINELSVATKLSNEKEALTVLKDSFKERLIPPIPASVWERKNWVDSLTPLQIAKLDMGRESLRKLDQNTYTRFAAIESQIENRPDSPLIQETIHIVGLVMDSLPHANRLDLEKLNQEQRIQYLKDQIYLRAAIVYSSQMPSEDTKALEEWDTRSFRPALMQEIQRASGVFQPRSSMDTKELFNFLLLRRRLEFGYQLDGQTELVEELASSLTETGRKLLTGVNRNDQLQVLFAWFAPERVNNTQALIEAYEKIGPALRDKIDLANPDQSKRTFEDMLNRPNPRNRR